MNFYGELVRALIIFAITFVVALSWTPLLTHFLFKYKLGKRIRSSSEAPIMSQLHAKKAGTPTMGGVLIWVTVLVVILVLSAFNYLWPNSSLAFLDFLSRSQTKLPLGILVVAAVVGLVDDFFNIRGKGAHGGGLRVRHRLFIYTAIALVGAWWFWSKLQWDVLAIPFVGTVSIGWWYIPIFLLVIVATAFSVNETDGLDGLAGGTLLSSFAAFGAIAFFEQRYELATLCAAIDGALLAFLWFNIFPARFYMGDTGAMGLGVTLGVVAMLTNALWVLPIVGIVFVVESLSVIIQLTSKKLRGKKIFISSPFHHHLEASGWPEPKIVMRFWIISAMMAILGVVLFLIERGVTGV